MNILVTGTTGFIGSELAKHLIKSGHSIHGLSRQKSSNSNITSISLSDRYELNSYFKKNRFDVVIHLAALISGNDPVTLFDNNCRNTMNLLECCQLNKVNRFIFASTHAVYGNTIYLPIDENHQVQPMTNYAISKLIAENICKMFSNSYGMAVTILRISSVYGEGQPSNYLIPRMIHDCLYNEKITLHKYLNGFQLMDLIHVKDVCNAIDLACKLKARFGTYNIASGVGLTVENISEKLSKITGIRNIIIKKIPKKTNHFIYDISNAQKKLRFEPQISINKRTLKNIIQDFKNRD